VEGAIEKEHVVQLSSATATVCARTREGNVYCWGDNRSALLGFLPTFDSLSGGPSLIPGIGDAVDVSASTATGGRSMACAVRRDTTVWCWGANAAGSLGHDQALDHVCESAACSPTPRAVATESGTALDHVASVRTGELSACVLRGDDASTRHPWCWGYGGHDVGAVEPVDAGGRAPSAVALAGTVSFLDLKYATVMAIDQASAVWAWGWNDFAQIANGTHTGDPCSSGDTCVAAPSRITSLSRVASVAMGAQHGAAIRLDGTIWAWGLNHRGQVGHEPGAGDVVCEVSGGSGPCSLTPLHVEGLP
jgi:alpha-tubulin suppressor-like RCC1 family protein